MRAVTIEIVRRGTRLARKHGRTVRISKTSKGQGVDVASLDPGTAEGRRRLDEFLTPVKRQYTVLGLGAADEPGAINWRKLNLPFWRRALLQLQVAVSLVMKGSPAKNRLYRWMGAHIGSGVEIMQLAWLDHFRPELIFVGDGTLIGAYSRLTVHTYEGAGRFRYGLVEIGRNCTIGAGTGMGIIQIGDRVRTLPGLTLSPHYARIPNDAVVSGERPHLRRPAGGDDPAERSDAAAGGTLGAGGA